MTKGGIIGMTLPIARDLAEHGIRVMAIAPGPSFTPSFAVSANNAGMTAEQAQERWGSTVPNPQRLGDPDEYSILAAQIVENDYLNGRPSRLDEALRLQDAGLASGVRPSHCSGVVAVPASARTSAVCSPGRGAWRRANAQGGRRDRAWLVTLPAIEDTARDARAEHYGRLIGGAECHVCRANFRRSGVLPGGRTGAKCLLSRAEPTGTSGALRISGTLPLQRQRAALRGRAPAAVLLLRR